MENSVDRLYEKFHNNPRLIKKVINDDNFTYFNVVETLKEVIGTNKHLNILDYGCGVGTMSMYLASHGHRVTGIDLSENAITQAKKNAAKLNISNNLQFHTLKQFKSSINNQKYNIIILIEVIEHLPHELLVLKKITAHLKRGGFLIISTPSINAPLYKLGLLTNFDKRVGHLRRYNICQLKNIMSALNLKTIKITKKESILRNSFYTIIGLGWIVKFMKGNISHIFMKLDSFLVNMFGESNIYVIAQKL